MAININYRTFWNSYIERTAPKTANSSSSFRSSNVPSFNYSPTYVNWNSNNVTQIRTDSQRPEEDNRTGIKVVASIIVIAGSALAGYIGKQLHDARENLAETVEAERQLDALQQRPQLAENLLGFVQNVKIIEEKTISKLAQRTIAIVALVLSSALLLAGAFAAVPILIEIGTVAAIVSLAGAAFSIAWNWSDRKIDASQKEIAGLKPMITDALAKFQSDYLDFSNNPPAYARI